jgi:hypothetical protein
METKGASYSLILLLINILLRIPDIYSGLSVSCLVPASVSLWKLIALRFALRPVQINLLV